MESPQTVSIEVAIGVVCALVGAVSGGYCGLWLERRKQRVERTQATYQKCLTLRETLADWMNELADATREEQSVEAVRRRLEAIYEHERFEGKIWECLHSVNDEPLCAGLCKNTDGFSRQAFESKKLIAMLLVDGKFSRDYGSHRNEALERLRSVYTNFQDELERVIPLLKQKARL